jgi:hypothetical protein
MSFSLNTLSAAAKSYIPNKAASNCTCRGWEAATAGGACESGSARHRSGPWASRRRSDRREACAKHEGAYLRLRRAPCLPCRHRKQRRDHQEDGSRHRGAQPEEKRNSRVSPSSRVVARRQLPVVSMACWSDAGALRGAVYSGPQSFRQSH